MNITAFALRRPVTIIMLFISVLVMGAYAYGFLPLSLLPPDMSYPFLRVYIPYPNSTPQQTERTITIPAEEMLKTVRNIHEMRSSSSENGTFVMLEFEQSTDMDNAYMEVKDRIERLKADLPEEVERVFIWRFKNTDIPIFWIGVEYDGELENAYHAMENRVRKSIQRIDGVANVELEGLIQPIVAIDLDINKLHQHRVPAYDLIQKLENDNFNIAGGTVKDGGQTSFIRAIGQFSTLEEIRNIPVKGNSIRLSDVAEVDYKYPIQEYLYRINGKYAMGMDIYKESTANTVAIAERVKEVVAELRKDPSLNKFTFHIFFNQADDILASLNDLRTAGIYGAIFAVIVLLFFIRHLTTTLIVTLSIPSCITATLVFMYFYGMSLNIVSMIGIMIAVGMIVDNAVVVVENVIRHRQMGHSQYESALLGAREVGLAILAGTLTTVIVFLPLIFTEGTVGQYLQEIGIPISVALISSLFIALTIIPLSTSKLLGKTEIKSSWLIRQGQEFYGRTLGWVLHNRLSAILLVIGILVVSFMWPWNKLEFSTDSGSDSRDIDVMMRMPPHFGLSDSAEVAKSLEKFFDENRERYEIENMTCFFRSTRGRMNLFLTKGPDVKKSTDEIREMIREEMPRFPGVQTRFSWNEQSAGQSGTVSVRLMGDNSDTLMEYAGELKRRMSSIPAIEDVEIDIEDATEEIHLSVDKTAAQKFGLTPFTIATTVSFGIRGQRLRSFKAEEGEVEMWIQFKADQTADLESLRNLPLGTGTGTVVPLGSVANFTREKGLGTLSREDGKTVVTVKGNVGNTALSAVKLALMNQLKDFELPQGYSWSMGRNLMSMNDDMMESMRTLVLSTVLVFLLMGALFESVFQPLVILFSIPCALPGMIWFLYVTDTTFDTLAWIGSVLLVGIVVNNSIVLLDHINNLRKAGLGKEEAIIQGGMDRLRPILMTASTTILGLLPMAFGASQARFVTFHSLGRAVMGGLVTGTMGTLLVIPLVYFYFDSMQAALGKLFHTLKVLLYRGDPLAEHTSADGVLLHPPDQTS